MLLAFLETPASIGGLILDLDRQLAQTMLRLHPEESARILEELPPAESSQLLREVEVDRASRVLGWMTPDAAARVLLAIAPPPSSTVVEIGRRFGPGDPGVETSHAERASFLGSLVVRLPLGTAAGMLRPLGAVDRERLLASVPEDRTVALLPLLDVEGGTAGELMDPDIIVLPRDIEVSDALQRLRQRPEAARERHYVVDEDRVLVGHVDLGTLVTAGPQSQLLSIMEESEHRIPASAAIRTVLAHPGWRHVRVSMPVVDDDGVLLGELDHRTLRRLEADSEGAPSGRDETVEALGDLFRAAFGGLVESVLAPDRPAPLRSGDARPKGARS